VARPKNPALAVRNDQIYALWKSGRSLSWLAEKYQRTPQQVGRIVAAFHPDLDDDDDRALHRGRLETLYEEVQEVVNAPGWKLAPNGRTAEDSDGNPLEDTGAKIEALKLKLMVLESARKLDARDKQQPRQWHLSVDEAWQKAQAVLAAEKAKIDAGRMEAAERAELEAYRQRFGTVIPGEIVPPAIEG